MDALRQIDAWPAEHAAAGIATAREVVAEHGDVEHRFGWGSVTKLLTAYATLIAAEEGALDLDEPAGPEGATVRHLLAHASGLAWDSPQPLGQPGERRVYSNSGYLALAEHVAARTEMPFPEYLHAAVLEPLGLSATLEGDAAGGIVGDVRDMLRFGQEALEPTLIAPETLAEATLVQFPGLDGVLPGFGRQTPNDWGLGFELRNDKSPHWTGSAQLATNVRALRLEARHGDVPLDRPRAAARRRGARGRVVRRVGGDRVAGARRRRSSKELQQQPVELLRALEARQMTRAGDRREPGVGERAHQGGDHCAEVRASAEPTTTSVGTSSSESCDSADRPARPPHLVVDG